MAFGLSPKHRDTILIEQFAAKQILEIAQEAAKKLKWKIGLEKEDGFTAQTPFSMSSWSEKVTIKLNDKTLEIKSNCTGTQIVDWGKNKKNVNSFIETFNDLAKSVEPIEEDKIKEETTHIVSTEDSSEEEGTNKMPPPHQDDEGSFLSLFVPTDGFFITPILLILNIVIFVFMTISGVHIMEPANQDLIDWGANFKLITLDGQWWRTLTSCFIHIGIFHLLMNMYALMYIGMLLEPYLGKARFTAAYILSGLCGSFASLWWNDLTISAGASGAIFGMYGVFLALLLTNLIEKTERRSLLLSIGIFVGYNLLNGIKGGIDNAAHLGGLISGFAIGFAFYPSIIKPKDQNLKKMSLGIVTAVVLIGGFMYLSSATTSDIGEFDKQMAKFAQLEQEALSVYRLPENSDNSDYMNEIRNVGIPKWNECLKVIKESNELDVPDQFKDRNKILIQYIELRIETYELMYKAFYEDSDEYTDQILEMNNKLEGILNQLEQS